MTTQQTVTTVSRQEQANAVSLAQKLIQIPSLSGQERDVVNACVESALKMGYDEARFDGMGNFIGRVQVGDGSGPTIVLTGHLDTVNADPAQWSAQTGPFSGAIQDGRLYGRGASDMKAAVACMMQAASQLKALSGASFSGQLFVVGTVVEELFEGVCFGQALEAIQPDFVIIGEASECRVNIAQRGRAEVVMTVHGIGKHASVGRTTINPIEQVAYVIDAFHRWYRSDAVALLGKRNIVPTDIKIPVGGGGGIDGRGGNSTVPNRLELTYDVRTLPGDTAESIMDLLSQQLAGVNAVGHTQYVEYQNPVLTLASDRCTTFTGVDLEQAKFAHAWKMDENCELVRRAVVALNGVGQHPDIGSYSFCTDGSAIVPYLAAHPERTCQVIGFGPSKEELAHIINEFVEVEQLHQALAGYVAIGAELLRR